MSHRCLTPDDLEAVRALPADDPRRVEAEACPRCLALLQSFAEFLEDRSVPASADPAAAAQQLRDAFERALEECVARVAADDSGADSERRPAPLKLVPPAKRSPWLSLTGPRLAWAAAAALLVVAGLYTVPRWQEERRDAGLMRGDSGGEATSPIGRPGPLESHAALAGLELRWRSAPGADGYRVVFLDESFARIAVLGPLADTVLVVEPGRLPSGLSPGSTVAWQVEALQGGFVIATSGSAVIRLP